MRFTSSGLLRSMGLALAALLVAPALNAANITVDGINYTTKVVSGENTVTVAKYTAKKGQDTLWYEGDIVIPEYVEYNGVSYKVIGTAANCFLDCVNLTSVSLPETCVTIGRNCFKGCTALTVSPVPATATSLGTGVWNGCSSIEEITIPAGWAGPMVSEDVANCPALKRLIFAESETPFEMSFDGFGKSDETRQAHKNITELYIAREIDASKYANNQQPFHSMASLQKVTFTGKATSITGTMFQGCPALREVVFAEGNLISSIGVNAFLNCTALQSIVIPEAVTVVQGSAFSGCTSLSSVTLSSATTAIQDGAFFNARSLQSIALPSTLTSIGAQAFMASALSGELVLPEGLASVGANAFAGTALQSIVLPTTLHSIGNAAFTPIATLASISADGNGSFKVENGLLTSANGKRLLVTAHRGNIGDALDNDVIETVDNYGFCYAPFKTMNLPALTNVGNYGFAYSSLEDFTLASDVTVGYNLFANSALKNLVFADGRNEIPNSVCINCAALESVTLPSTATNIMQGAFSGCSSLKEMELPANVNYMEPGAVPTTIERLRVLNATAPVLAAGVFSPNQSAVECKVATASVPKFQSAPQWCYLNIVADPSIQASGSKLGCPTGLYFATKDGKLMYKDEDGNVIDTEFATGAHAFNLASYKNRIYVGVAGVNFRYQGAEAQANGGDGEVFYVNNSNGIFYRVTVLNNVGYQAFYDPFSLSILEDENKIVIADRNVGVHEMSADTVGLYGTQPFLVQNNQLPYYNNGTAGTMYGGIGCGFYKVGGVYWMGKKFNGFGVFRFNRSDIGRTSGDDPYKMILPFVQMTQFYVDEANGYMYFYLQSSAAAGRSDKPGVYRLPLSVIYANDQAGLDTDMSHAVLLDDSPVLKEGDGDEITGITQFTSDGENVYWAYIASPSDDKSVPNSIAVDASNPLHHSGIKCVTAKPATDDEVSPVQFALEGVEAYGVAGATYVAPPVIAPTSITLNVSEDQTVSLLPGETFQLEVVAFEPIDADTEVTYESSDESIATVDENGLVTAVAPEEVPELARRAEEGVDVKNVEITVASVADPNVKAVARFAVDYTPTGVETINSAKSVASVKYINAAGLESSKAFEGVNVVVTKYTDGTQSVAKVVK